MPRRALGGRSCDSRYDWRCARAPRLGIIATTWRILPTLASYYRCSETGAVRAPVTPAATIVGEPQSCVSRAQLRETRTRNDSTIDFIGIQNGSLSQALHIASFYLCQEFLTQREGLGQL